MEPVRDILESACSVISGSTSLAKYCVSATAKKDDMELIAVVMAAPDYKIRFADATTLLNYGFGKCHIYSDSNEDKIAPIAIEKGTSEFAGLTYEKPFSYISTDGSDLTGIKKTIELPETATAPIKKGDVAGRAVYSLNGNEIGHINILYTKSIDAASYKDYFLKAMQFFLT